MTHSFYYLEKYEDVIEYGKKCLEHDSMENPDLNRKLLVLYQMKIALVKLDMKQEAVKYARELLKVDVTLYNANRREKFDLLLTYYYLIDLHIQVGDSKRAKRIFEKHLKLFNLNSMNLNDVLLALKEEGYEKVLPKVSGQTNCHKEFAKKIFLSKESLDYWMEKVRLFYHVGKICWLKHIVYFGGTSNLTWGNLSLKVYIDILKQFKLIMENRKEFGISGSVSQDIDRVVRDAISKTLLLTDQNHLNRENLFSTSFFSIRSLLNNVKNVSYYVAAAQRENGKINIQKVMPFIQFCLKSLDEEGASSNENVDLRLQFVMLKNSLMINNHFNVEKEEY